ncbi:unnamed protein product [Fusarium graminearum]|uniref:Amidase domain-containing protein n=1 Tax=Gibberella zeae TaxID=5518 RepID=A0A679NMK3_GIBZA|nr:unnamed protein product [Fusarium graminearum]CZS74996.1 unnamed protein product [Fusarium graminearum]
MLPITTCFVAGLQYLLHPVKLGTIQETINPDALIPVTLLTTDEIFGDIEGVLNLFDSADDVFVPDFGSILVEKTGSNSSHVQDARQVYHLDLIKTLEGFSELPSGPYFLHGPNLHQAWRLYDDEFGAFTFGVIPDDSDKPDEYQPLTSSSLQGDSVTVPVPSRLYYPQPSLRKPLSGIRVSVGDTVSLKGTHTTFSSRAWKSLYKDPSSVTANYAQELLDQGAIIVGKTKTAQFGTGADWVDQQAPWSARGDGYQRMQGSSIGAASALVGYEWLDRSIGVDDGRVVAENGIYSLIRPANISSGDVKTLSKFDGMRFFSRSMKGLLHHAPSHKLDARGDSVAPKVIIPVDLSSPGETQKAAIDKFVSIIEEHLDAKAEYVDVSKIWEENPPVEASNDGMQSYISQAPFRSWCYDYYHSFDDFRDEYQRKFHKEPFIETAPQFFWEQCKSVTEEEHGKDAERLEVFRKWFHDNVMNISTTSSADTPILVLPCGDVQVKHRNEPMDPPTIYKGVDFTTLAPVLGASVLSFPFTQVSYKSDITGKTEYQPVCISVLSLQDDQTSLIQLVEKALRKGHVPTQVDVGRMTFPVKKSDHFVKHLQAPLLVQGSTNEL